MSDGECKACKKISNNFEGCDVTSTTPVCDSDKDTTGTQSDFSAGFTTTPECVACRKDGKSLARVEYYLCINKLQIKFLIFTSLISMDN